MENAGGDGFNVGWNIFGIVVWWCNKNKLDVLSFSAYLKFRFSKQARNFDIILEVFWVNVKFEVKILSTVLLFLENRNFIEICSLSLSNSFFVEKKFKNYKEGFPQGTVLLWCA